MPKSPEGGVRRTENRVFSDYDGRSMAASLENILELAAATPGRDVSSVGLDHRQTAEGIDGLAAALKTFAAGHGSPTRQACSAACSVEGGKTSRGRAELRTCTARHVLRRNSAADVVRTEHRRHPRIPVPFARSGAAA